MQNPMSNAMQMTNFSDMHTMAQLSDMPLHHLQQSQAPQPPSKGFACSSCGKGFARRSDLSRHGKKIAEVKGFAVYASHS
jgi:hypothetical protein